MSSRGGGGNGNGNQLSTRQIDMLENVSVGTNITCLKTLLSLFSDSVICHYELPRIRAGFYIFTKYLQENVQFCLRVKKQLNKRSGSYRIQSGSYLLMLLLLCSDQSTEERPLEENLNLKKKSFERSRHRIASTANLGIGMV